MSSYTFAKACNSERLAKEIADSAIITALDYITTAPSETVVYFKAALSSGDETILNGLVDAHVNEPLPFTPTPREVVTLMEKDDKALRLAHKITEFTDNVAEVAIKIPGEIGTVGRYVAGGYGFTDVYYFGDRITKVQVIDKDYIYAGILYAATPTEEGIPDVEGLTWAQVQPNGVVLGGYSDEDVNEDESGWALWCEEGNQGGVDIDPIGGYGHLLAQAYLSVTFVKEASSSATKAAVNLWWGKYDNS